MNYEAVVNRPGAYRVVLEERPEGVYINVFESPEAEEPYIDWLAPHLQGAKLKATKEFGIHEDEWKQAANEHWH
jgi:hypothetical protein